MTDPAALARSLALHCEVKKYAYRQTKDGVVLSVILHPDDLPRELATAAIGTRYLIAFVELADDEQPK